MEADKVTKPIYTSGEKHFIEKQFPFPFIFTSAKLKVSKARDCGELPEGVRISSGNVF